MDNTSQCKGCKFYAAFYIQHGGYLYKQLDYGICYKNKRQENLDSCCKKFECGQEKALKRKEMLLISLERSLNAINNISQILKNSLDYD